MIPLFKCSGMRIELNFKNPHDIIFTSIEPCRIFGGIYTYKVLYECQVCYLTMHEFNHKNLQQFISNENLQGRFNLNISRDEDSEIVFKYLGNYWQINNPVEVSDEVEFIERFLCEAV